MATLKPPKAGKFVCAKLTASCFFRRQDWDASGTDVTALSHEAPLAAFCGARWTDWAGFGRAFANTGPSRPAAPAPKLSSWGLCLQA